MDFEDYLSMTYIPLKAIEVLTDFIYVKCNEDWNFFMNGNKRSNTEELLSINYAIKLCANKLLDLRQKEINNL